MILNFCHHNTICPFNLNINNLLNCLLFLSHIIYRNIIWIITQAKIIFIRAFVHIFVKTWSCCSFLVCEDNSFLFALCILFQKWNNLIIKLSALTELSKLMFYNLKTLYLFQKQKNRMKDNTNYYYTQRYCNFKKDVQDFMISPIMCPSCFVPLLFVIFSLV